MGASSGSSTGLTGLSAATRSLSWGTAGDVERVMGCDVEHDITNMAKTLDANRNERCFMTMNLANGDRPTNRMTRGAMPTDTATTAILISWRDLSA
jgi:hypothetical protein